MIVTKRWVKENWVYFTPFMSWGNRLYHWIKRDEDVWDGINRNLMCAAGTIALCIPLQIAVIVILIIRKL